MARFGWIPVFSIALVLVHPTPARAQESVRDVLSFLLTNRSIPTDDFVRDEEAAAATRDSVADFLLIELATFPVSTSAGAFTYRLNPSLGVIERSSDSFGPFVTDRSLTVGRNQSSLTVSYQAAAFDTIDGRSLRDGTLVATASTLRGAAEPFDVETVTLRIRTDTVALAFNHGATDQLDLTAVLPVVRLSLSGQRLDTYRGAELLQALGSASASGIGDVLLRAKYNVFRSGGSGVSAGGEVRLPTGDRDNLLGSGELVVKPRVIGSFEANQVGVHGEVGYGVGGLSRELTFGAAVTAAARPNLTLIGEFTGRRFASLGRLEQMTEPHPRLSGVDTIRLTGVDQALWRVVAVAGVKWNVAGTWLVSGHVSRPLTSAGLNAGWVPTITLDYSFAR